MTEHKQQIIFFSLILIKLNELTYLKFIFQNIIQQVLNNTFVIQ